MDKEIDLLGAQKAIVCALKKGAQTRAELLALGEVGLSKKELADKQSGHILNKRVCMFGNAIEELTRNRYIEFSNNKYVLLQDTDVDVLFKQVVRNEQLKDLLLKAVQRPHTKKELLEIVTAEWREKFPKDEVPNLRSCVGEALAGLEKSGEFEKKNGLYKQSVNSRFSHPQSGEQFESDCVALFEYVYKANGYGPHCECTGGSGDGGVDGKIEWIDPLGLKEKIIIQAKHTKKCEKSAAFRDVQAFCGALTADSQATKGIFVINGTFHHTIVKFAAGYPKQLILIDGKTLCELVEKYQFEFDKN